MFSIEFLPLAKSLQMGGSSKQAYGEISIGSFREHFLSPIGFWKRKDYIQQWGEGIDRLKAGKSTTALIVSLTDPEKSSHLFWWKIYRVDDRIHFQNQLIVFDQLNSPFNIHDPYVHIGPRETLTDEGNRVSEWTLCFSEFIEPVRPA